MAQAAIWQEIRALRASPTGSAATESDRRGTFVASLRQAEELAAAADAAGYAARPLPLFYALSQAGRAIAAAHLPGDWKLRGHGLTVRTDASQPLLATLVVPASGARDSFSGVARALQSPILNGPVQLGALWAANPDLRSVPIPNASEGWAKALEIHIGAQWLADHSDPEQHLMTTGGMIRTSVEITGTTGDEVAAALGRYPSLRDAFCVTSDGRQADPTDLVERRVDHEGKMRVLIAKTVPDLISMTDFWKRQHQLASYTELDKQLSRHSEPHWIGYALPDLGGSACPSPLSLWWALLLGLSSLARYQPALWTAAIDLDASDLAVSLERVLDIASERVPTRILEALRK